MGLRKPTAGKILLNGSEITSLPPGKRIKAGISHVPEDRQKRGIVSDFSVMENLILGSHRNMKFTKWGQVLNLAEASAYSDEMIDDYSIDTPSKDTHARNLSGGNQQRLVVAREFSRKPKLIIAAQPTRGLDVGATEYVRRKLLEMRDQGSAVLLLSADLDEIWAISDRIAVLYEGRVVATRDPKETSQQELGLLMAGGRDD